jgi:hypothetical protein
VPRRRALGVGRGSALAVTFAAALAAAALAGCPDDPPAGAPDAAPLPSAPAPTSAAPASPAGSAAAPAAEPLKGPADDAEPSLQLLRLTLTSGVKDKEPADKLDAAPPGARVYAHLAIRNRSGEPGRVKVEFQVNGKTRTTVELDVQESWQWRTWGYCTLRDADSGELTVIVTEEGGPELKQVTLPIRGRAKR